MLLAADSCRAQRMFPNYVGFRSAPPARVTMWVVVEYTDTGARLYQTTTPDIAARAKMRCGAVKVDRATTAS